MDFNFVCLATRFECARCAKCCSLDVMLSDEEMVQLSKFADTQWRTTKKVQGCSDMQCILLEGHSCKIYGSRPRLCQIYPFLAVNEDEFIHFCIPVPESALRFVGEDGRRYVLIYDDECPGVGKGSPQRWSSIVNLTVMHLEDFKGMPVRKK